MDIAPFGKLLREYRLNSGLSQESLAERAAMSVNGISALERGANQTPQRKTLELLVKALSLNAQQARALEEAAIRRSRARSAENHSRRENVPRPLTPFFGRRELLDDLTRLVLELPLVTLTGPGGIGKTRLALKAADELAHRFADGVAFVDLAPLRDRESVLGALAAERLADELHAKSPLLLIDNCEHVAAAVAYAVEALITQCPRLRILVTSRQSLNVPGEQVLRVPPLELDAAVELFMERAKRAVGPAACSSADADAIGRIVRRLDGIALAIELAAARMNLFTLRDLEQHLAERFHILSGGSRSMPRHQAMRATMDWSYELLPLHERRVFGRLWVFPGSFSLDAVVAVCAKDGTGKWQIFEALASLVDRSLVNSAPEGSVQRYRLLETTRAYAAECMASPGDIAALHRRHADYYGELAENAAAALECTESTAAWAHALEPELENFRAALDWTLHHGDVAAGVRMLSNLQEFWIVAGISAEAERRAHEVLQREADLPNTVRAALWLTIARMRQELFVKPGPTLDAATTARRLYEASGDRDGLALAMRQQAAAHMRLGAFSQARTEFEQSLEIYQELGDERMAARGLGYLASLLQVQGDFAQAHTMLLHVLQTARSAGDDRMIPTIVMNLAETEFALGRHAHAVERARENLSNAVLQKSSDMRATQEANLSSYLLATGRIEDAQAIAMAAIENSTGAFIAVPLQHLAAAIVRAQPEIACKILGYVEKTFASAGFSRENTERFTHEYLTAALSDLLDERRLAVYCGEGAAMSEAQILDLARAAFRVAS